MAPYGAHRPDSEPLREQVRARIASGARPRDASVRLFGGYGDNQLCAVCGGTISPTQVLYEIDFHTGAERKSLQFHLACHAAWQLEIAAAQEARAR